jgi:hypothetical protein
MIFSEDIRGPDVRKRLNDATPEEWDRVSKILEKDYDILDDRSQYQFPSEPSFSADFSPRIEYKFREDQLINELQLYIDKTYAQHYAGGKIQATEDIIDDGHGTGFCIGNAKKYLKRYGKKGETPTEWRKDIIKVLHYALIQLYIHDLEHGNNSL